MEIFNFKNNNLKILNSTSILSWVFWIYMLRWSLGYNIFIKVNNLEGRREVSRIGQRYKSNCGAGRPKPQSRSPTGILGGNIAEYRLAWENRIHGSLRFKGTSYATNVLLHGYLLETGDRAGAEKVSFLVCAWRKGEQPERHTPLRASSHIYSMAQSPKPAGRKAASLTALFSWEKAQEKKNPNPVGKAGNQPDFR